MINKPEEFNKNMADWEQKNRSVFADEKGEK